jgi:hypothetical protein
MLLAAFRSAPPSLFFGARYHPIPRNRTRRAPPNRALLRPKEIRVGPRAALARARGTASAGACARWCHNVPIATRSSVPCAACGRRRRSARTFVRGDLDRGVVRVSRTGWSGTLSGRSPSRRTGLCKSRPGRPWALRRGEGGGWSRRKRVVEDGGPFPSCHHPQAGTRRSERASLMLSTRQGRARTHERVAWGLKRESALTSEEIRALSKRALPARDRFDREPSRGVPRRRVRPDRDPSVPPHPARVPP